MSSTLKVKCPSGAIQELRGMELLEIDGTPFEGFRQTNVANLEDRVQILERLTKNLCDFMDQFTFSSESNSDSEISDALKPVPSFCEAPN